MRVSLVSALLLGALVFTGGCGGVTSIDYAPSELELLSIDSDDAPECSATIRVLTRGTAPTEGLIQQGVSVSSTQQRFRLGEVSAVQSPDVVIHLLVNRAGLLAPYGKLCAWTGAELYLSAAEGFISVDPEYQSSFGDLSLIENPGGFAQNVLSFLRGREADGRTHLVVLALDRQSPLLSRDVERVARELNEHPGWWAGVFVEGCASCAAAVRSVSSANLDGSMLFLVSTGRVSDDSKLGHVSAAVSLLASSVYEVPFSFAGIEDFRRTTYDLTIATTIGGQHLERTGHFDVPDMQSHYLEEFIDSVLKDESGGLLECALRLAELRDKSDPGMLEDIREYAIERLESCMGSLPTAEEMNDGSIRDGRELLRTGEEDWSAGDLPWFRQAKLEFLIALAQHQDRSGFPPADRLAVYEEILALDPGNIDIGFASQKLQADMAREEGRLEEALSSYDSARVLRSDSDIDAAMVSLVRALVERYYAQGRYSDVVRICAAYTRDVGYHVSTRHRWAESAKHVGAYGTAIEQYNWLEANYNPDTAPFTYDQLIASKLEIFTGDMRYQRAFDELKRIHLDGDWEKPIDLDVALVFLRGEYVSPFMRAMRVFLGHSSVQMRGQLKTLLGKTPLPDYVQAIYVLDNGGNIDSVLYGDTRSVVVPPSDVLGALLGQPRTESFWFVSRVAGGRVVVQIDRSTTNQEQIRLDRIREDPTAEAGWDALESHVRPDGKRAMVALMSAPVGIDLAAGGRPALQGYSDALRAAPGFKYAVIQGPGREILHGVSFNRDAIGYGTGDWEKSSDAVLLMELDVLLGEQHVSDLTYPLYAGETRYGVLRLGISRM